MKSPALRRRAFQETGRDWGCGEGEAVPSTQITSSKPFRFHTMTDEEEYAARSQLKWRHDGNAWVLLRGRRRMGRVVPGMYDLNISRAKDRVLAQAVREVAWDCANHPSKCPVKRGVFSAAASPTRYSEGAATFGTARQLGPSVSRFLVRCDKLTHPSNNLVGRGIIRGLRPTYWWT